MKTELKVGVTLAAVSLSLLGCGDNKPAETAPPVQTAAPKALETPSPTAAEAGKTSLHMPPGNEAPMTAEGGKGTTPPFAGGASLTAEEALASVPKSEPKYAPLQKKQDEAEAALKAKPADEAAKKAYVEQTYAYGHELMAGDNSINQKVKYRAALALFRRALKVDSTHAPTLADKKMIEDIYGQMGLSIPQ